MAQHVRRALPERPGQQLAGAVGQFRRDGPDLPADPQVGQHLADVFDLGIEPQVPPTGSQVADGAQGVTADRGKACQLPAQRRDVAVGQPTGQLTLQGHHGEAVPEQVVDVAGQVLAFDRRGRVRECAVFDVGHSDLPLQRGDREGRHRDKHRELPDAEGGNGGAVQRAGGCGTGGQDARGRSGPPPWDVPERERGEDG